MRKELIWVFENNLWLVKILKRARFFIRGWHKRTPLKLNVGSGFVKLDGYLNVDKYEHSADLIMDAMDLKFKDSSVDLLESHHFIEHLTRKEVTAALREWHRVLKPGATLVLECPDLIEDMKRFLDADYEQRWNESSGIIMNIFGEQFHPGLLHKTGFDYERLHALLEEAGFEDVKRERATKTPEHCLRVSARKA